MLVSFAIGAAVAFSPAVASEWVPMAKITDHQNLTKIVVGKPEKTKADCERTQQLADAFLSSHPEVKRFELLCKEFK